MNLILISSVINITKKPLSYTTTRSVFSSEDRFDQTLKTIASLQVIPNRYVVLIEGSKINSAIESILCESVDRFIEVYRNSSWRIKRRIKGYYKSIAEGTLLIEGLKYFDITQYENIYKISGRYYLTSDFDINCWLGDDTIFWSDGYSYSTTFYKINRKDYQQYLNTLAEASQNRAMIESIFKSHFPDVKIIEKVGVAGKVSVNGDDFTI